MPHTLIANHDKKIIEEKQIRNTDHLYEQYPVQLSAALKETGKPIMGYMIFGKTYKECADIYYAKYNQIENIIRRLTYFKLEDKELTSKNELLEDGPQSYTVYKVVRIKTDKPPHYMRRRHNKLMELNIHWEYHINKEKNIKEYLLIYPEPRHRILDLNNRFEKDTRYIEKLIKGLKPNPKVKTK